MPYFLSRYDPDPLRYYLTATAPETRDTEFFWEDFVERNDNELVTTWGNLGNGRGGSAWLSFAYKRFDGKVPEPGDPGGERAAGGAPRGCVARRCGRRRRCSKSWMRAWSRRSSEVGRIGPGIAFQEPEHAPAPATIGSVGVSKATTRIPIQNSTATQWSRSRSSRTFLHV
ncbi:MAG: class I tRNA ligase family protein [Anaerolineae bacterium]|nr:class I tRNA ligase family protein [Anaerolineae bacterium]